MGWEYAVTSVFLQSLGDEASRLFSPSETLEISPAKLEVGLLSVNLNIKMCSKCFLSSKLCETHKKITFDSHCTYMCMHL